MEMAAIRALTPAQRSQLWVEFQDAIESMERAAIHRAHPLLDANTKTALLIKRRHGVNLAAMVFPGIDLTGLR
jgi:hypothetical protein